jgi:hypothetical protein
MVSVRDRRGNAKWLKEYLLDGLIPEETISHMKCEMADELGLCAICDSGGARCHVLVPVAPHSFAKYCPVLWHDVFKPSTWKVENLT